MKTSVPGSAFFLWIANRGSPICSQTTQTIAIVLFCPPELDGKRLLLKTLHHLSTGHKEVKLDLNKEYSPCWLAFIMQEDPIQDTEGEKSLMVLPPSCEHFKLYICQARCVYWYNCGTTVWGITNCFLIEFEVCFIGGYIPGTINWFASLHLRRS